MLDIDRITQKYLSWHLKERESVTVLTNFRVLRELMVRTVSLETMENLVCLELPDNLDLTVNQVERAETQRTESLVQTLATVPVPQEHKPDTEQNNKSVNNCASLEPLCNKTTDNSSL